MITNRNIIVIIMKMLTSLSEISPLRFTFCCLCELVTLIIGTFDNIHSQMGKNVICTQRNFKYNVVVHYHQKSIIVINRTGYLLECNHVVLLLYPVT